MSKSSSRQLHSVVPAGSFTFAIANVGGTWLPPAHTFVQDTDFVSLPLWVTVPDLVHFIEGANPTKSGVMTQQFTSQARHLSHEWMALASYNWLIAGQETTVAFIGTMKATVWSATHTSELMSWFWLGGLASRPVFETRVEETQATGTAITWILPTATVANPAATDIPSSHQEQLAKWTEKLDSLANLAPGWNRQGAPAPSELAIQTARQFLKAMVSDGQPPTRVAASAVGGVGVTREVGERIAYIEFYNDGAAYALLADNEGDEHVVDVTPAQGTFRDLLDKVKTYLHG